GRRRAGVEGAEGSGRRRRRGRREAERKESEQWQVAAGCGQDGPLVAAHFGLLPSPGEGPKGRRLFHLHLMMKKLPSAFALSWPEPGRRMTAETALGGGGRFRRAFQLKSCPAPVPRQKNAVHALREHGIPARVRRPPGPVRGLRDPVR